LTKKSKKKGSTPIKAINTLFQYSGSSPWNINIGAANITIHKIISNNDSVYFKMPAFFVIFTSIVIFLNY